MARKKTPVAIQAATAAVWFCDDDHLHIEKRDHNENPVAAIQFDLEDGAEIVAELAEQLGLLLIGPDDLATDDDEIGPTVGNA